MYFQAEKDILSELNIFINGASQSAVSNPLDLSKTAVSLLKTLPTARDAILEYFCTVFDVAVNNYIVRVEKEIATGEMPQTCSREEATVSEIHNVLCNFVSCNPQAWAPIISTWSLELLGELSSRYAGRAHVSVSAGLNETLQLWMGCRSTRTLIDITTQCLTCLMDSDSETWMNALLDTSVKHSPNFDWVVAHVGSCFPNTVITRVLSCGLKDFCQHKTIDTGRKAPKLASVVGILGHLAGSHFGDIRTALLELFTWSLQPYNLQDPELKSQKMSTVPFLLQLASTSPTLLNAMSTNIKQTLKGNIILRLCLYINDWCKYFGSAKALQDLLVRLILDCEQDGFQVINLLLEQIHMHTDPDFNMQNVSVIKETCREILECILQEIDLIMRTDSANASVKLLYSLTKDTEDLHKLLLNSERLKYETATRVIMLIGKANPTVAVKSTCFLLRRSKSYDHLAMLVRIINNVAINSKTEGNFGPVDVFGRILKHTLLETAEAEETDLFAEVVSPEQMWQNLLILLKWEKSKRVQALQTAIISQAIFTSMKDISHQFGNLGVDPKVRHVIGEILHICITSVQKPAQLLAPHVVFSLVNSNVNYFFLCCSETDLALKVKGNRVVCDLFTTLTVYSKAARVIALRELLERSLFKRESLLFGAEPSEKTTQSKENQKEKEEEEEAEEEKRKKTGAVSRELLLYKNHKHSTTMMLSQRNSSMFHSGVIGSGKRKPRPSNPLSREEISVNVQHMLQAVKACCYAPEAILEQPLKKSPVSLDALTLVSLFLVQFVSPDVMYNGLPWPEEEFSKVTIERDLYIRRLFSSVPILWQLLRLVAVYRPVLCYCSVLLRALAATLLHQWSSGGRPLDTTVRLLDVLATGQLLPPPLANIRDVLPHFSVPETAQVLRACVWNYMRDHVPSPALFGCDTTGLHWRDPTVARPPPPYTDTLRTLMHRNIDRTGDLYAQYFVNVPHEPEQ